MNSLLFLNLLMFIFPVIMATLGSRAYFVLVVVSRKYTSIFYLIFAHVGKSKNLLTVL